MTSNNTSHTISSTETTLTEEELSHGCRLGLDSHAGVSCIGKHGRITEVFHGKLLCQVQPFNDSYQPMQNIKTVNANFAYDTPDGRTYIIEVNQALDFTSTMEHSLLCTNQARFHGVVIDDVPKPLDYYNRSTHSIYFPEKDIRCPLLSMHGPISFLPVRYPTDEGMDTCPHLELTSVENWDPHCLDTLKGRHVSSVEEHRLYTPDLATTLECSVYIVDAIKHESSRDITPTMLSNLWNISLEAADRTLKSTTQDYIRTLSGKVHRHFKTRAHQRQYKQLGAICRHFVQTPSSPMSPPPEVTTASKCLLTVATTRLHTLYHPIARPMRHLIGFSMMLVFLVNY
jgi:hypothetical protein